jgi:hypothetical protein
MIPIVPVVMIGIALVRYLSQNSGGNSGGGSSGGGSIGGGSGEQGKLGAFVNYTGTGLSFSLHAIPKVVSWIALVAFFFVGISGGYGAWPVLLLLVLYQVPGWLLTKTLVARGKVRCAYYAAHWLGAGWHENDVHNRACLYAAKARLNAKLEPPASTRVDGWFEPRLAKGSRRRGSWFAAAAFFQVGKVRLLGDAEALAAEREWAGHAMLLLDTASTAVCPKDIRRDARR